MAQNQCIPYFTGYDVVSGTAAEAVTGKTFLAFTTGGAVGLPSVAPAPADTIGVAGVAAFDQEAGKVLPIHTEGLLPVTAGADVVPGDLVKVGENSQAVPLSAGDGAEVGADNPALAVGVVYIGAAAGADAAIKLIK